jgi:hypothetical protein
MNGGDMGQLDRHCYLAHSQTAQMYMGRLNKAVGMLYADNWSACN